MCVITVDGTYVSSHKFGAIDMVMLMAWTTSGNGVGIHGI